MARSDGFLDPRAAATWRRMLWVMRGSAGVVEALVPVAAGLTKDEIARLLARASGNGSSKKDEREPIEQVMGLLGVVPKSRHEALLQQYEVLRERVEEAEKNIERLQGLLRDQGHDVEAEQLLDSWGGLLRRTLRAQAGFVRSIAGGAGTAPADPETGAALLPSEAERDGSRALPADEAVPPRWVVKRSTPARPRPAKAAA
ncbi:MAG: hypothetical protein WAM30_08805, partial [Candidatus Dormiibacterota bacterium]